MPFPLGTIFYDRISQPLSPLCQYLQYVPLLMDLLQGLRLLLGELTLCLVGHLRSEFNLYLQFCFFQLITNVTIMIGVIVTELTLQIISKAN